MIERSKASFRRMLQHQEEDPLVSVANLFDAMLVFSIAILLVAKHTSIPETAPDPVDSQQRQVMKMTISNDMLEGEGERLGVAYRLANGQLVYVPGDSERSN